MQMRFCPETTFFSSADCMRVIRDNLAFPAAPFLFIINLNTSAGVRAYRKPGRSRIGAGGYIWHLYPYRVLSKNSNLKW